MKINTLVHILETQAKAVSEAKIKVATLFQLKGIEFEDKDKKKFDSAINNLQGMIVSVYSGIKYKVKYDKYSDKLPLYNDHINFGPGYNFLTQISLCQGILLNALNEVEKMDAIPFVYDPKTMENVKIKKAFKDSKVEAKKFLKSSSNFMNPFNDNISEEGTE